MYNLNINVTASTSAAVNNLLAVENASTTPRTPEILNTLIAMTNPLDSYNFNDSSNGVNNNNNNNHQTKTKSSTYTNASSLMNNNESSNSSGCTATESPTSPPSVQQTCSQLIKAGLKLSIQSKRKFSADSGGNGSNSDLLDLDNCKKRKIKGEITGSEDEYDTIISPQQGLTPEDEERRRRRRERNKIAATKCRLKKREKTVNLVHESETLETQNIELKTQIQQLESQRRQLVDMLSMHSSSCIKNETNTPSSASAQSANNTNNSHHTAQMVHQYDRLAQQQQQQSNNNETKNSYLDSGYSDDCNTSLTLTPNSTSLETLAYHNTRAPSVDIPLTYNLDTTYGDDDYSNNIKPIIIINDPDDPYAQTQLTDLDSPNSSYEFNASHCHNNYDAPAGQNTQSYATSTGLDNGCMA